MYYTRNNFTVKALKFNGSNLEEIALELEIKEISQELLSYDCEINTGHQVLYVKKNDYIIKNSSCNFSICDESKFNAEYVKVSSDLIK